MAKIEIINDSISENCNCFPCQTKKKSGVNILVLDIIHTGWVNQFTSRINNKLKLVWMKTQSNPERKQLRPKIEAKAAKDSNGMSTNKGCLIVCLYMSHLSFSLGF